MIEGSVWLLLTAGILLILGTGVFVAGEFAIVNLDRADLQARAEKGERRLGLTIGALRKTSTHLSSAQLGITLTTVLTGFTLEPALSALLRPALAGLGAAESVVTVAASILGMVVATLASMVVGELVPKNFALAVPRAAAKVVMPLQVAFTAAFRPAVWLLNESANGILRLCGVEPQEELSGARTADELSSLVRRSARAGALESDTATLLDRTLKFSRRTAGDVMTPRPRLTTVHRGDSVASVITTARSTGLSRFPVVDHGIDDISGIVHVKQAVAVPRERRDHVPVSAVQRDVVRVPETMPVEILLGELRSGGFQMALVVDEYGGTSGVVTLEDVVEEIVGEVADEHDRTRAGIVRSDDEVIFPGLLRPDELAEQAGVSIPEDGAYETVAGFILTELDRMAAVGDEVYVAHGMLRVERMDGHRIDRVRFVPTPPPSDGEGE